MSEEAKQPKQEEQQGEETQTTVKGGEQEKDDQKPLQSQTPKVDRGLYGQLGCSGDFCATGAEEWSF